MSYSMISASRLLEAFGNYGNPLEILVKRRWSREHEVIRVVDRRSGVAVRCKLAAHRMFGEVWFDHDYEVPGVPLRRGDVVIDIGGNQGFYTCYAAWQGCWVYTFEPDRENFTLLEANVRSNGFADRVKLLPMAVKLTSGAVQLFRTDKLGGGMHTTNREFAKHQGISVNDAVEVTAMTLPELFGSEKLERVRLCKMDCEGAELEILQSLTAAEAARVDAFALEFHPDAYPPTRLVEVIESWGTHHIFAAAPKYYCQRDILYAVTKLALRETMQIQAGRDR